MVTNKDNYEKYEINLLEKYNNFLNTDVWKIINYSLKSIPCINNVWSVFNDLSEKNKTIQILHVIEFFTNISENKEYFIQKLQGSEQAIMGLGICFDSVIKSRSKEKRVNISLIFKWYFDLSDKEMERFDLERLLDINKNITVEELKLLKLLYNDIYVNERFNKRDYEKYDYWLFVQLQSLWIILLKNKELWDRKKWDVWLYLDWMNIQLRFTPLWLEYLNFINK